MENNDEDKIVDVMGAGLKSSKIAVVEDPTVDEGLAIIQLYDPPTCLRCSHLLSMTDDSMDEYEYQLKEPILVRMDCHYSYGNQLCPAKSMRITKYTDIDKAVDTYLDVLKSDDPNRLASYMSYVGRKDKRTGQLIMERIKEITNRNTVVEEPVVENVETEQAVDISPVASNDIESEEQKT